METLELFRTATMAIRTNKTRSFLTALGIIIGVASVILLVSIGNGLQAFVTKQFQELGSNLVLIAPGKVSFSGGGGPPVSTEAKFTFEDVAALANLGTPITDAMGSVLKPATAKYLTKTFDVTVAGISENYSEVRNLKISKGSKITQAMERRSQRAAVIGSKVVDKLFRSGEDPIGKEINVSNQKLTVVGVAESKGGGLGGGSSDADTYVYVPVTTAQKMYGIKRPASVAVVVDKAENTPIATVLIKRYFQRRNLTSDDYTILEPKELLNQINTFLGTITVALSGIAAISLVVGGIGIANIMFVSVTERTREIGLRKAVGATYRDILTQFLLEAVMLSVLGGVIGILFGSGLSLLLNRVIQTSVSMESVMLSFGISCAVGVTAGIIPALRAAKLDPIVALRWE